MTGHVAAALHNDGTVVEVSLSAGFDAALVCRFSVN
jgi:hypothetical protein